MNQGSQRKRGLVRRRLAAENSPERGKDTEAPPPGGYREKETSRKTSTRKISARKEGTKKWIPLGWVPIPRKERGVLQKTSEQEILGAQSS